MRKFILTVAALVLVVPVASGQELSLKAQLDRLLTLEENFNAMMASQARMQGDIANIRADVAAIKQQLAAPKPVAKAEAPLVWQPPVLGAWGETRIPGRWVSTDDNAPDPVQAPVLMQATGGCANGSCGVSRGRFFRR